MLELEQRILTGGGEGGRYLEEVIMMIMTIVMMMMMMIRWRTWPAAAPWPWRGSSGKLSLSCY